MDGQPITIEDAAKGILAPESTDQPEPKQDADVTEVESEEPEELEADAEEVENDEPEGEADDDTEDDEEAEETEDDDDPVLTMPDGTEVKFSELQSGYMRQKDYTQKTQALAQERRSLEQQRQEWESDQQTALQYLQQQHSQLQDALATFAVDQAEEPDPDSFADAKQYLRAKKAFDARMAKKQQAAQYYRQLQEQQHQQTLDREQKALLKALPEWADPDVFRANATEIVSVGRDFGFSDDEMASLVDHRMFLVLNELKSLRKAAASRNENKAKVAKKIAEKASKKPDPSARPKKQADAEKLRRQRMDRLKRTGSLQDAALAILRSGP